MKKIGLSLLAFIFLGYLAVCILMYIIQNSFIYYPGPIDESKSYIAEYKNSEIIINHEDINLHGWLLNSGKSKLIIYYGGNGEEVSHNLNDLSRFKNYSILLLNYRGYGKSEGSPDQDAIFEDALFIYDRFSEDYEEVILFGRSLGTGVASYVAGKRNPSKNILVTPFDCLANVAQSYYPYLPVNLLITQKFDSVENIKDYKNRSLVFIAGTDKIIPNKSSYNLAEKLGDSCKTVFIKDAGHNDIQSYPEYWKEIARFL
ncbi:MAG: alpha/beta hydrolase [Melioribacteraceae bacterium]|nr:alpha/beta hydrolase [Melioribacteraceae bacterium]